jgi:hypothetical protein
VGRPATLHADIIGRHWGEFVTRRFALSLASILAVLALVVGACSNAPAAPALTDPKEILTQSLLSLKDVKTVELVGSLSGTLEVAELGGNLDLSSTKMAGALDIPNQKAKFTLDAPALMGTKIDAIIVDGFAYVKIDGILATMAGGTPGKYTKEPIPQESNKPVTDPSEIAQSVDEIEKALDELPNPPTKEADEKCGDQDCYHVQLKLSAEDLAKLSPEAGAVGQQGDLTFDVWSRKSDLRPAKVELSVTSPQTGTIGFSATLKYDGTVDVTAPPADQVAQ